MKKIIAAITLLSASAFAGSATAYDGAGNADLYGSVWSEVAMERMVMMEKIMDANHDKMVSKAEYMKFMEGYMAKKFAMMDIDNDGMLSHLEFVNTDLAGSLSAGIFLGK